MRRFIKRALQKADTLKAEQIRDLLLLSAREIDRLEIVMDSLPRGILVCDTSHKLILANKAARRLLSIVSYEQARETVWSVIPDEIIAEFLAQILLSTDKAEECEFEIETNGVWRFLSVSVMAVVQNGRVSGSLILIDDITERRNREAKLRLAESLASLTTLAAGVAHEIKNPLGALSIHIQLVQKAMAAQEKLCLETHRLQDSECEPSRYFRQIDRYLKVLNEEVERLNGIVVDFLFAVRPMNAKLLRGDINALVTDVAEFLSVELKAARVETVLNLAENLPAVDFDSGLMRRALINLLLNAEAAMPSGGKLTITTEEAGGEVLIVIADTGAGISEENILKIFEPYFTTKENGNGLGLTVLFKIIREHRGEINVRSREGEGTVFTISLPVPQTGQRLITYKEANPTKRNQ